MHKVYVMASDIHERIGGIRCEPVLEVGIPVMPFLHQARAAEPELSELAGAIAIPRHQASRIESLVVLHPHQQAAIAGYSLDFEGVLDPQHQRLDATHVLVGSKAFQHDFVMKLVRYRHHDHGAFRKSGERPLVVGRPAFPRTRAAGQHGLESDIRKCAAQSRGSGQRADGLIALRTH